MRFQEPEVALKAAHEDMLPVVVPDAVALKRPCGPAETMAAFQQSHSHACIGGAEGGRETCQSPAHHDYVRACVQAVF